MCSVLDLVVQVSSGYLANAYTVNDVAPSSLLVQCHSFLPPDLLACEQSLFWLDRATTKTIKLAILLPVSEQRQSPFVAT